MRKVRIEGLDVNLVDNEELKQLAEENEEIVMLTMRCADVPEPYPGSTVECCSVCGFDVWVSPGSRMSYFKETPREKLKILCLRCLPEVVK